MKVVNGDKMASLFKITVASLLLVYILGLLVVGFFLRKKVKGKKAFFAADRSLSTLFTSLGLSSSILGSSMSIGIVATVYSQGLSGLWMALGPAFFLGIMGLFLAKEIRKKEVLTFAQLLGKLFSKNARYVTAIIIVLFEILWIAVLITASRDITAYFLGIPPILALLISVTVFSVYTMLGGKFADAYTDLIQAIIMAVFGLILLTAILYKGFGDGISDDQLSLIGNKGPINIMLLFFLLGLSYLVGPDVYSAIISAKDQKVAERSALISSGIVLFWGVLMAVFGLAAISIIGKDSTSPLIDLVDEVLSLPFKIFAVVGLMAVLMSSVDTTLHTGSSAIANDLLGPALDSYQSKNKNNGSDKSPESPFSDKKILILAKLSVVLMSCLSILVVFYLETMMDILYFAYLLFTTSVVLPTLAGLFKRFTGVTTKEFFGGLISGGLTTLIWYTRYEDIMICKDMFLLSGLNSLGKIHSTQILGLLMCLAGMVMVWSLRKLIRRRKNFVG